MSLWDGGVYVLSIKPSVLFAAWADGTVVRVVGGRLKVGTVAPEVVVKLLADVDKAGFRHPSISWGIETPDGPVRILSVVYEGHASQLHYDGSTNFDSVGPNATPSRIQLEAFVQMW